MKEKQDKKSHRPEATADPSEQQTMASNNNTPQMKSPTAAAGNY